MTELARLVEAMREHVQTMRKIAEKASDPARAKMMRRVRLRERQLAEIGRVH